MEYKTIVHMQYQDKGYNPPDDVLNATAAEGWEVIGTNMATLIYAGRICEVFYFARRRTGGPPATP